MAAVITSITGLQNLTNLIFFNASNNGLQSIDFSGLITLEEVRAGDNNIPGSFVNSLTSINVSGCVTLRDLILGDSDFSGGFPDLSGLNSLVNINFNECGLNGSVDLSTFPLLETVEFPDNPMLTELIISDTQPIYDISLSECGLTETAVDNILVALSNNGVSNGTVSIVFGTNAIPSATGLAAKTVLEGNGWTVNVNS
jgi:hypothetical protein